MNTIPTDQALATPAQNSENTNNPLLAVASSAVVLPDCPQDVGSEGFKNACLFISHDEKSDEVIVMSTVDKLKHRVSKKFLRQIVSGWKPSHLLGESRRLK